MESYLHCLVEIALYSSAASDFIQKGYSKTTRGNWGQFVFETGKNWGSKPDTKKMKILL